MTRAAKWILGFWLVLAAAAAPATAPQKKDELKKLADQIGLLESVLNQSIAQRFGGPFGILDKARGAYLPGYGVVVDFELNLSPSTSLGPFASLPTAREMQQQRALEERRRKQVLELAQSVLAEYGHTLSALGPDESVAIVIHTVALQQTGLEHTVMVVEATKKAIDEYRSNAISRAAFLRGLEIVEY